MKRVILSLLALAAVSASALAQAPSPGDIKITFADGHTQMASAVRRSGNTILATVALAAGVRSETGYPVATIRSIDFPDPTQIKKARAEINSGNPAGTLGLVNALVAQQSDFRAIPGNFWAPAAMLKLDALIALGRDKEAEPLIKQLLTDLKDPDQLQGVSIAQALLWLRAGRNDEAIGAFDKAIAESQRPANLARAWQGKGQALLAKQDYDGAIFAYLRVPIFYSAEVSVMPAALLGAARSYEGLHQLDHADETLAELVRSYPNSTEAKAAKADRDRIQKKISLGETNS